MPPKYKKKQPKPPKRQCACGCKGKVDLRTQQRHLSARNIPQGSQRARAAAQEHAQEMAGLADMDVSDHSDVLQYSDSEVDAPTAGPSGSRMSPQPSTPTSPSSIPPQGSPPDRPDIDMEDLFEPPELDPGPRSGEEEDPLDLADTLLRAQNQAQPRHFRTTLEDYTSSSDSESDEDPATSGIAIPDGESDHESDQEDDLDDLYGSEDVNEDLERDLAEFGRSKVLPSFNHNAYPYIAEELSAEDINFLRHFAFKLESKVSRDAYDMYTPTRMYRRSRSAKHVPSFSPLFSPSRMTAVSIHVSSSLEHMQMPEHVPNVMSPA